MTAATSKLVTVAEAARRIGIHRDSVRKLIDDGRLPAVRIPGFPPRVDPRKLDAFIAGIHGGASRADGAE